MHKKTKLFCSALDLLYLCSKMVLEPTLKTQTYESKKLLFTGMYLWMNRAVVEMDCHQPVAIFLYAKRRFYSSHCFILGCEPFI